MFGAATYYYYAEEINTASIALDASSELLESRQGQVI
jgi:hypothetical protein